MARKKPDDTPPPGSPAWMTTYGDMVTLVLTFFVLLFSFSSMDAGKWQELVGALSGTMGVLDGSPISIIDMSSLSPNTEVSPPSDDENDDKEEPTKEEIENDIKFGALYDEVKGVVEGQGMGGRLDLEKTDAEIIIRFSDTSLFDSGRAALKEDMLPIFDKIYEVLSTNYDSFDMLRVEGHTDNLPINTPEFPNNRRLSVMRALSVADYMLDTLGFNDNKLSYMGFGETRPIDPADTEEARAKNRRVELIVVKRSLEKESNLVDVEDFVAG